MVLVVHASLPYVTFALLTAALTVVPLCANEAQPGPGRTVVRVRAGTRVVTGIPLNSIGHIVVPATAGAEQEWLVELDNERFPATLVSHQPRYGLAVLKVQSARPVPCGTLSQRQAPLSGKYRLVGFDAAGKPVDLSDAALRGVRRRLPEAMLEGSFYEIVTAGDAPPSAALVDPATGHVLGLLLPPTSEARGAVRFALFAASISERAALENIPLGTSEPPAASSFWFADGRTAPARMRHLHLGQSAGRENLKAVRAIEDWRRFSGFWINRLTPPTGDETSGYLGSTRGTMYCFDIERMQRLWAFENEFPVFSPPSLGPSHLVCTSGNLGLTAWQENDASLLALLGVAVKRTRRQMVDYGNVTCLDRKSGVFAWEYKTRFLSGAAMSGDRVAFAGMGTLGVLNLADGRSVWNLLLDRTNTTPFFYVLGGIGLDRMWVLKTKVNQTGMGTRNSPLRLEQEGSAVRVECYLLDKKKTLWSTPLQGRADAPALNGALILGPDHKSCYGASARSLFAVDAETGVLKWSFPIFSKMFGGNIAFGDNLLFATSSDNLLYAVDPADGKVLWQFSESRGPLCAPLALDGVVYVGSVDTWIYALDARSGNLVWKLETGGRVCGQPRLVNGKLYFTTDDGRFTELELPL